MCIQSVIKSNALQHEVSRQLLTRFYTYVDYGLLRSTDFNHWFMVGVTGQQGILTPPRHLIPPLVYSKVRVCHAHIFTFCGLRDFGSLSSPFNLNYDGKWVSWACLFQTSVYDVATQRNSITEVFGNNLHSNNYRHLYTYHAPFYWIILTTLSLTFISKSVINSDELTKLHIHKGNHPLNYDVMIDRNIKEFSVFSSCINNVTYLSGQDPLLFVTFV